MTPSDNCRCKMCSSPALRSLVDISNGCSRQQEKINNYAASVASVDSLSLPLIWPESYAAKRQHAENCVSSESANISTLVCVLGSLRSYKDVVFIGFPKNISPLTLVEVADDMRAAAGWSTLVVDTSDVNTEKVTVTITSSDRSFSCSQRTATWAVAALAEHPGCVIWVWDENAAWLTSQVIGHHATLWVCDISTPSMLIARPSGSTSCAYMRKMYTSQDSDEYITVNCGIPEMNVLNVASPRFHGARDFVDIGSICCNPGGKCYPCSYISSVHRQYCEPVTEGQRVNVLLHS